MANKNACDNCWKETQLCVCAQLPQLTSHKKILILQHPQEARNQLGTARLLSLALPNTIHRVGLSWPSLSKAVGAEAQPRHWGVLFLGTSKQFKPVPEEPGLYPLKGKKLPQLHGLILLDGNWKQSKTLWWRNPWLLRVHRLVLNSPAPSAYGSLRRQPRKACLSTIEAAAECLNYLGENPKTSDALKQLFATFVDRANGIGQGDIEPHTGGEAVPSSAEGMSNIDDRNVSHSA